MLISAARGERSTWTRHRGLLLFGVNPLVPAPVLAQAWRGGPRQAMLARLLAGCDLPEMTPAQAREIGELLGAARMSDVVDASVVEAAVRESSAIVTADRKDIDRLVDASGQEVVVDSL